MPPSLIVMILMGTVGFKNIATQSCCSKLRYNVDAVPTVAVDRSPVENQRVFPRTLRSNADRPWWEDIWADWIRRCTCPGIPPRFRSWGQKRRESNTGHLRYGAFYCRSGPGEAWTCKCRWSRFLVSLQCSPQRNRAAGGRRSIPPGGIFAGRDYYPLAGGSRYRNRNAPHKHKCPHRDSIDVRNSEGAGGWQCCVRMFCLTMIDGLVERSNRIESNRINSQAILNQ